MFPSQNIEMLKKDFQEDKAMALFLGAGCDLTWVYPECERYDHLREQKVIDRNLLSWKNLLNELMQNACIDEKEIIAIRLLSSNSLKAAVLKNKLGSSYIPVIQNWLYSHCNQRVLLDSYKYYKIYQENPSVDNLKKVPFGTLFVLAEIILRQGSIKAVFTQNYNNYLSETINILLNEDKKNGSSSYGVRQDLESIDVYDGWQEAPLNNNCLLIYHVHGYIPPPSEMLPKKESNHIVLSDEEFYQLSKDVFSWQNVTQLNFLSHYTCIMLGLSLEDMTSLRLLRYANIEKSSEKIYWIRGGEKRFKGDKENTTLRLLSEYYESQHIWVVNDRDGYAHLYHELLTIIKNKSKKNNE